MEWNKEKAPVEPRANVQRFSRRWAIGLLIFIVLVVLFFVLGGFALLETGNPDRQTNTPVTQPTQVPETNPSTPSTSPL